MGSQFDLFKKAILQHGEAHKACAKFMNAVDASDNYARLRAVLYKFWPSFIMEHRDAALSFLELNYERFHDCFSNIEIFYNESTEGGRAIYYSKEGESIRYDVGCKAEAWALGYSYVKADYMAKLIGRDHSVCYYEHRAKGQLFDHCVGRLYDGSSVSSNDHAEIHVMSMDCSFVSGGESVVYARSFRHGKAFGKSVVKGPSDKNLQLFDEAKYIKMDIR